MIFCIITAAAVVITGAIVFRPQVRFKEGELVYFRGTKITARVEAVRTRYGFSEYKLTGHFPWYKWHALSRRPETLKFTRKQPF